MSRTLLARLAATAAAVLMLAAPAGAAADLENAALHSDSPGLARAAAAHLEHQPYGNGTGRKIG